MAITAPFTGTVADVIGRKRVIVSAMVLLTVPTVMVSLAPTLGSVIFWRFVQGLALPPIFAVTVAYIGDEWPAHEATAAAGVYTSGASLGGFSGRFITGMLSDLIGWRHAFDVLALMTLTGAVLVFWLLPRERKFVRPAGLMASGRQMLGHFRNGQLLATYAVGFGVLFYFVATFTYISFQLAAPPYNLSPTLLGTIFLTYLAGSALTPWTGHAVNRLGRRGLMIGAIGLWMCGIALTLMASLWAILAGLTLCTICGLMCQSVSTGYVTVTAQAGRSSAVGLYVTAFYFGGSFGAMLGGVAWNNRRLARLRRAGGLDASDHDHDRDPGMGTANADRNRERRDPMNPATARTFSARQLAVGIVGYCCFINLYSPQSILPLLSHDFGASAAKVSTIITVSTMAVALTAPFTGTVADVLGRKRVIVTAMFLLAIPTIMVGLSPNLTWMITWRGIQGLVLPPIFAVTVAYIGDEWPHNEAATAAGIYSSGSSFGGFSGRLVTGFFADWLGWRYGFFALACVALTGAIAVALLLPRERKFVRSEGILASGKQMLRHVRNPQLLSVYAVGFGVLFNFIATFTFVSFHLAAPPYNLSPTWLGVLFVTYLAGSALTPWTGWAVTRFGRRRFMTCGDRDLDRRRGADAGLAAAVDRPRPDALRRLRPALPGGVDGERDHHRQGRPLVGGRTLRHELLRRRKLRRRARRPRLDVRQLAGLRRDGSGDAGDHGRHRPFRLDAGPADSAHGRAGAKLGLI